MGQYDLGSVTPAGPASKLASCHEFYLAAVDPFYPWPRSQLLAYDSRFLIDWFSLRPHAMEISSHNRRVKILSAQDLTAQPFM